MKPKLIYVSSPYSRGGDVAENVRVQMDAAHRILDLCHCPVVPLLSHFLAIYRSRPYDDWMRMDLALLERCDVVLRLPGESSGADREVAAAQELGMPVVFGWEELDRWLLSRV
jgi:hypothetical protein